MWLMPLTERFQAVVFGGPSRFVVKQLLVANVQYDESYPYDEIRYAGAEPIQQQGARIGYNAGADLSFFFSRHVGVGALVRLSRATVKLPSADGGEAEIVAGGTHVGAGVRFRF
jgi:hypothetical protein